MKGEEGEAQRDEEQALGRRAGGYGRGHAHENGDVGRDEAPVLESDQQGQIGPDAQPQEPLGVGRVVASLDRQRSPDQHVDELLAAPDVEDHAGEQQKGIAQARGARPPPRDRVVQAQQHRQEEEEERRLVKGHRVLPAAGGASRPGQIRAFESHPPDDRPARRLSSARQAQVYKLGRGSDRRGCRRSARPRCSRSWRNARQQSKDPLAKAKVLWV
jgi:hypothetical protein